MNAKQFTTLFNDYHQTKNNNSLVLYIISYVNMITHENMFRLYLFPETFRHLSLLELRPFELNKFMKFL